MRLYQTRQFEYVHGSYYEYRELAVDGKYLFSGFLDELRNSRDDVRKLMHIYSLMAALSPSVMLPARKFRKYTCKIDGVFEFKKDDIRVYVLKKSPEIYVVLGGYKDNQKRDVGRIEQLLRDINI